MLKIAGGEHRGRKLRSVPGDRTRPTAQRVRQAVFDIASTRTFERALDVFAGTGAMALEALSRGACQAVAIEKDARAAAVILTNARELGLQDRLSVIRSDALAALRSMAPQPGFDLLYADPPYAFDRHEALLQALVAVARTGALVVVEHASGSILPPIAGLLAIRTYRYGTTALSVFKAQPNAVPPQDPGSDQDDPAAASADAAADKMP